LKALIARSIRRCFESRLRRRLRPVERVSSHRIEKMRILRINALNALNVIAYKELARVMINGAF
jgi:hypothetical protein